MDSKGRGMLLLEAEGITKNFGGLQALQNIGFHISKGELLSIVGPNGSGKTTLFNIITGFHKPTKGRILFEGKLISGLSPYRIARAGIGRTFQVTALFDNLSILDNVILGFHRRTNSRIIDALIRDPSYRREEEQCLEKAKEVLRFIGLGGFENEYAGPLPSFSRKRLAIAIALVSAPGLLLLDEPAAGWNVEEIDRLASLLKQIQESGVTLCVIEHKMKFVMALSDRVMVLNEGRKIVEGTPLEVSQDRGVIAAYLGK